MGPKTRQMNTRYRVKQTSTPLKEGDVIHSFPSLKNISSVKVLRKRTITLTTESSYTLKNKTKRISSASRRSEQKFSIGSKKYNSKPRQDTPLKPRNSFMTRLSSDNPKRLKFSQISDTLDILNSFENEDNNSRFGEAIGDESNLEITGDTAENTVNVKNVAKDTWNTLSTGGDTDELDDIKMPCKTSNLQTYSVSEGNISSDNVKHSLQTRVVSELTMDTSSSLETCRTQSSSFLLPPSLNFSPSEDILSEGSATGNLETNINLEPLNTLSQITKNKGVTKFDAVIENGCAFNRSISWTEVKVGKIVVKEADYASNCMSPNPYVNHDSEFTLEKNITLRDEQNDNIHHDKDENTKETVSDSKFGDHLQHNATMLDIQNERKYERNCDILSLRSASERKSSESRNSANACSLANLEKKSKDIFKIPLPVKNNNAKKKSRDRRKKTKEVRSPSIEHCTRKGNTELSTKCTIRSKIPIDVSHANVVDDASNNVATIPCTRQGSELRLEKDTLLHDLTKSQILDAKNERMNMTDSDRKFDDHLQHNIVDTQIKRKHYKRRDEIMPLPEFPGKKSSESQDSDKDFSMADSNRKIKDTLKKRLPAKKNKLKKKSKTRQKKAKDVRSPSIEHCIRKESTEVSTKSTILNKISIDVSHANVVYDASNNVATIPGTRQNSELRLEKDTPLHDLPKAQILDAKNVRMNMTVSDGKFNDHIQHNATLVDVQTERKNYKKRDEIMPLPEFSGKKSPESEDSVKDFSLADSNRKIKGTFKKLLPTKKNKAKKKLKVRQKKTKDVRSPNFKPSTEKKSREVKKRNGKFTHPSTSTPLIKSNLVIERFAAPLEHISPLGTLKENILMGYELDDLYFKRTSICKTYGRQKSELSRRWDSFSRKSRKLSKIVKEDNCKEESQKLKRSLPRTQTLLFKTPPSYSLSEIPIDDILKSRHESMNLRKKIPETRNTDDETSTKWNECTKIRQLADHFKDISKYSLIVENKRCNKK